MPLMTRRTALKTVVAAGGFPSLANPQAQRPNFLVVVTDDQRWDAMSCAGNKILRTPHMDRLAQEGVRFTEAFGPMAYTFHGIAVGLRDLGMTMNPQGAHYSLLGIETLSLRMEKHVRNAMAVARWLESDDRVAEVTYAGLESSPWFARAARICPKGAGAIFTIRLKGGYDACVRLVNNVKLFSHVANLGDTRSLIIHSASTTHRQLTEEQQRKAGVAPDVVRLSIGIEDPRDLIADLDQALGQ